MLAFMLSAFTEYGFTTDQVQNSNPISVDIGNSIKIDMIQVSITGVIVVQNLVLDSQSANKTFSTTKSLEKSYLNMIGQLESSSITNLINSHSYRHTVFKEYDETNLCLTVSTCKQARDELLV